MGAAGVPASGVVVPAAREAVNCTRSGRIGVLATLATARSGAFEREIAAMAPDASVLSSGTAELVPLVEAGRTSLDDDGVRAALTGCLAPFTGGAVDTLILGCTHYPLLGAAIAGLLGPEVRLIDAGAAGARETACLLREGGLDCRARRIGGLSPLHHRRPRALRVPGGALPGRRARPPRAPRGALSPENAPIRLTGREMRPVEAYFRAVTRSLSG